MRHNHKSILCELSVFLTQHQSNGSPLSASGPQLALAVLWNPGQSPRPICLLRVFHERLRYQRKEDFLAGLASELCFLKSLYPWVTSGSIVGDALHPLQQYKWNLQCFAWSLWGYNMLTPAKSSPMYHCHWALCTILYQIQAALLFINNITDSKVCKDTKFLLVMLQSEAAFILDCIYSLICPKLWTTWYMPWWPVSSGHRIVNQSQFLLSICGGEVSRFMETQRISPNPWWWGKTC